MTSGIETHSTAGELTELGTPHTRLEDAYALVVGAALLTIGLLLLARASLVTGEGAGMALIHSYLTGGSIGPYFIALTIPPIALLWSTMGWPFMIKTLVAKLCVLAMTWAAPNMLVIDHVHPLVAAILGGSIIGMDALALARHGAATGGTGIVLL
jgi:uncharacterized membrane-anchored protein YitT (DUF2179 family)